MELIQEDIQKYIELGNKIDTFVKRYYNKNIHQTYYYCKFADWELAENKTVRIIYSFIDYNDERCHDYCELTLEELNLNQ